MVASRLGSAQDREPHRVTSPPPLFKQHPPHPSECSSDRDHILRNRDGFYGRGHSLTGIHAGDQKADRFQLFVPKRCRLAISSPGAAA